MQTLFRTPSQVCFFQSHSSRSLNPLTTLEKWIYAETLIPSGKSAPNFLWQNLILFILSSSAPLPMPPSLTEPEESHHLNPYSMSYVFSFIFPGPWHWLWCRVWEEQCVYVSSMRIIGLFYPATVACCQHRDLGVQHVAQRRCLLFNLESSEVYTMPTWWLTFASLVLNFS